MTKAEALYNFWSSFTWPAYDELTVPTGDIKPDLPYITYETSTDSFGGSVALTASLWSRSTSWVEVENKASEIAQAIAEYGYRIAKIDDGYLVIYKRTPFAQHMEDPSDDSIRRIVLNISAEFLTAY